MKLNEITQRECEEMQLLAEGIYSDIKLHIFNGMLPYEDYQIIVEPLQELEPNSYTRLENKLTCSDSVFVALDTLRKLNPYHTKKNNRN